MTALASNDPIVYVRAAAWPIVVVIAIIVLLVVPNVSKTLGAALSRIRKFSAFNFEFELNSDSRPRTQQNFDQILGSYRRLVNSQFDHKVREKKLSGLHEAFVEDHFRQLVEDIRHSHPGKDNRLGEFRSTIYVPDALDSDSLYQILDYYPSGGGKGRTRSIRLGIIGQAWRLEASRSDGAIKPSDPRDPKATEDLIRDWGLTRKEAAALATDRRSFACVMLRKSGMAVGLIYFDSKEEDAFFPGLSVEQANDAVRDKLEPAAAQSDLPLQVSAITEDLAEVAPILQIPE
jgi:hypothetical protein